MRYCKRHSWLTQFWGVVREPACTTPGGRTMSGWAVSQTNCSSAAAAVAVLWCSGTTCSTTHYTSHMISDTTVYDARQARGGQEKEWMGKWSHGIRVCLFFVRNKSMGQTDKIHIILYAQYTARNVVFDCLLVKANNAFFFLLPTFTLVLRSLSKVWCAS